MFRNGESLNPLFIRSQFQISHDSGVICIIQKESQSLIHQVSVSDCDWNVVDGDADRKSQSLIHQVSVSDGSDRIRSPDPKSYVSIPYSSGLSFR